MLQMASFKAQNHQYQCCLSHTSYLPQTFSLNLLRADRKAEWRPKITWGQLNRADKYLPQVPDMRGTAASHREDDGGEAADYASSDCCDFKQWSQALVRV